MSQIAAAFAPASIGNVGVGFDVLGMALEVAGDLVTVEKTDEPHIKIESIVGIETLIPTVPSTNTAGAALIALQKKLNLPFGFRIKIEKGIPLGSGMGGSAASAVAAIVAANSLLEVPLDKSNLLEFAVAGEGVASGSYHVDNIAPSLLGGLTLATPSEPLTNRIGIGLGLEKEKEDGSGNPHRNYKITHLPYNKNSFIVLLHPHIILETKTARKILSPQVTLSQYVLQSSFLAGFIAACFNDDEKLMGQCLRDIIIEPQRAELIPGFYNVQRQAMEAGALGCSISGAGPSIFAWARDRLDAERIQGAMKFVYDKLQVKYDCWISPLSSEGARLVPVGKSLLSEINSKNWAGGN